MADPFSVFHKDKVVLHRHPKFLPKVVPYEFHINQPINLPVFFLRPHAHENRLQSLDAKGVLVYYLNRTRQFQKSPNLFITYGNNKRGQTIVSQTSKWARLCIEDASLLASMP